MNDIFKRPIKKDDVLAVPGGQSSQLYMTIGRVVEVREDKQDIKVQPISPTTHRDLGMPIRLRRPDRAVIIDLPAVKQV